MANSVKTLADNTSEKSTRDSKWGRLKRRVKSIGRRLKFRMPEVKPLSAAIKQATPARRNKFVFESLEQRLLFSADPVLAMTAYSEDLTLTIVEDENGSALVRLLDNTQENTPVVFEQALSEINTITITGTSGDDVLTLDASLTELSSPLMISFDGKGGNDTIVGPAGDVEWSLTSANDGEADLIATDVATSANFSFDNVEAIDAGAGDDTFTSRSARLFQCQSKYRALYCPE